MRSSSYEPRFSRREGPSTRLSNMPTTGKYWSRRKIRLIESNTTYRHLQKFTCKGNLRQVFICLKPRSSYPPSLTHCIRVYTTVYYSHSEGGRVEPERRLEVQQFTKLGGNTNMTDFISSLYTLINTCRTVPSL